MLKDSDMGSELSLAPAIGADEISVSKIADFFDTISPIIGSVTLNEKEIIENKSETNRFCDTARKGL